MKLQIHRSHPATQAAYVAIEEDFPSYYDAAQRREVCVVEARALYDALRATLPIEAKEEFAKLILHGGL